VLIVADNTLQDLRFGGRFPTNPEAFIHFLQESYEIQAEHRPAPVGYTLISLKAGR
jgi:ferric-dicitrate binding protein FerR (iron transport regulator)